MESCFSLGRKEGHTNVQTRQNRGFNQGSCGWKAEMFYQLNKPRRLEILKTIIILWSTFNFEIIFFLKKMYNILFWKSCQIIWKWSWTVIKKGPWATHSSFLEEYANPKADLRSKNISKINTILASAKHAFDFSNVMKWSSKHFKHFRRETFSYPGFSVWGGTR